MAKKIYSLFIGRYQPPHEGHIKLMRVALDEGKNVCIGLRDTGITPDNPYSYSQRFTMFDKIFNKERHEGRVEIISIPDIEEICYGRGVGYGIREIRLDAKTQAISATKIRLGETPDGTGK